MTHVGLQLHFTNALFNILWSIGVDWDNIPLDNNDQNWKRFIKDLLNLEQVRISNFIDLNDTVDIQLHSFCECLRIRLFSCCLFS